MEPVLSVALAQRIVAIFLFVLATAPVLLFGVGAVCQYQPASFFKPIITVAAYPGGGAQWFAYLALLISTWAGTTLGGAFVVRERDTPKITRFGVAFLVYVAISVALGFAFVMYSGIPSKTEALQAILPQSLVDPVQNTDPGGTQATARALAAINAISQYVHWAIGSLLTLAAAVLAMPAPTRASSPQGNQQQQGVTHV